MTAPDCTHTNIAITARQLRRRGQLEVFDTIYRSACPWDGALRRNTRVSNDIFHLRHTYDWSIETVRGGKTEDGRRKLATYRLIGEGLTPEAHR